MRLTTTTRVNADGRAPASQRAISVAGATLAALAVWAIAVPGLGVDLVIRFGSGTPQTVGIGSVVTAALVASLLGWGLLSLLERRARQARVIWTVAALAALAASFSLPLIAGTTASTVAALSLMHVAVAGVLIPLLPARRFSLRRPRLSLAPRTVLVGAVAAIGIVTAGALTGTLATAVAAARHATWGYPGHGAWNDWGQAGPQGRWPGFGPGSWPPGSSRPVEFFHVASTNPAGPGAIIVTGKINDGGTEHPGRAVDHATFSDGTFRIDHSSGRPTVHFNATTCIGTITQSGPFRVFDGTGRFSHFNGRGVYRFAAIYATSRGARGCTRTVTAYIETINGAIFRHVRHPQQR